jgi:hypothetical protein
MGYPVFRSRTERRERNRLGVLYNAILYNTTEQLGLELRAKLDCATRDEDLFGVLADARMA